MADCDYLPNAHFVCLFVLFCCFVGWLVRSFVLCVCVVLLVGLLAGWLGFVLLLLLLLCLFCSFCLIICIGLFGFFACLFAGSFVFSFVRSFVCPCNMPVHLRDESAQNIVCVAAVRQKLCYLAQSQRTDIGPTSPSTYH